MKNTGELHVAGVPLLFTSQILQLLPSTIRAGGQGGQALLGLGPNWGARHSTGKINEIMQLPSALYRRSVKQ